MATVDKDFKVKNGLVVAHGGTFGGPVAVATPTLADHAATKGYVDNLSTNTSIPVSDTAPLDPSDGNMWFDTVTQRIYVYYNSIWNAQASLVDAEFLQDHIHDTAIDGSGLIVSVFKDAGYYDMAGAPVDAGFYNELSWTQVWDGGIAIDNFN